MSQSLSNLSESQVLNGYLYVFFFIHCRSFTFVFISGFEELGLYCISLFILTLLLVIDFHSVGGS